MEDRSGVTRGTIDELPSSDLQGIQIKGENDVTPSIMHELHS